jgi:hypothetical protein
MAGNISLSRRRHEIKCRANARSPTVGLVRVSVDRQRAIGFS